MKISLSVQNHGVGMLSVVIAPVGLDPKPGQISAGVALWPPDWSQFVPDLINTAVVGLLVGIGLWIIQTKTSKAERRKLAESIWRHHRAVVLNAASRPLARTEDLRFWEPQVQDVLKAAKPIDIVTLSDALPDNPEVRAVAHLVREQPILARAQQELRSQFRRAFAAEALNDSRINAGMTQTAIRNVIAAGFLNVEPSIRDQGIAGFSVESNQRIKSMTEAQWDDYLRSLVGVEEAYTTLQSAPIDG